MKPMIDMWLRVRRSAKDMFGDIRGLAATEFAIVVPVMLLLFFGTDEFASGIAIDRKVTLIARTLSDLTSTLAARVQWSKGSSPRTAGTTVPIPTALQAGGTYLIYSEVSYAFVPTVGYVLKNSITLSDFTFTRPRQSTCVMYSTTVCTTT
jgi:Flp pilus assembly protein TadG